MPYKVSEEQVATRSAGLIVQHVGNLPMRDVLCVALHTATLHTATLHTATLHTEPSNL